MNILLWVLQIVLAWLCIAGGFFQIFRIDELKKGVASMRALPGWVWTFLGAFGCVAGLGLVLPGILCDCPQLVPIAATAIALHSILISGIYIYYGDRSPLGFSAAMAVVAAFIAFGRFALV